MLPNSNKPQQAAFCAPAQPQIPPRNLPAHKNRGDRMISPENPHSQPVHDPALVAMVAQNRDEIRAILADVDAAPSDAPPHPLAQPEATEALHNVLAQTRREVNLTIARALADYLGVSLTLAIVGSMFCWRLNMGAGWWTRTIPQWADDLGCSPDTFERMRNAMEGAALVARQRPDGRYNPAQISYRLNADLMYRIVYDYCVKVGKLVLPITVSEPQPAVTSLSPVDNFDEEMGTEPQPAVNGTASSGYPIERKSLENHKTPPTPPDVIERSDAQTRKKPPPDPAQILLDACGALEIRHDEPELRAFCVLADVTPAEAREVARQAQNTTSRIEGWTWFRAVILKNRMKPKPTPQATAVGVHQSHTASPALEEIKANIARPKTAPEIAEPALRESLAALKNRSYANRKG